MRDTRYYNPRESMRMVREMTASATVVITQRILTMSNWRYFCRRWVTARKNSGIMSGMAARTVAVAEKDKMVMMKIWVESRNRCTFPKMKKTARPTEKTVRDNMVRYKKRTVSVFRIFRLFLGFKLQYTP